MMKTLNNNIFNSIYFLAYETNKIDKFNNIIEMNYMRNVIKNIILDCEYLLLEDKTLKDNINVSLPLIRETNVHLNHKTTEEDIPDFSIYFLSGTYFSKNSQKTIEFMKNCKPTLLLNIPLFKYFISQSNKKGSIIFFEDTISMNFSDMHTLVDDNFNIIESNKKKEIRLLYLQNNIIKELSKFFKIIFKDHIYNKQNFLNIHQLYDYNNLLLLTYPSILVNNIEYTIPKVLEKVIEYFALDLYDLLAIANIKLYCEMKFNLNLQIQKDRELLDKVIIQTILTYCLHPYITNAYFEKENIWKDRYDQDKENCIEFAKCLNDIINMWISQDFQSTNFEYKYYYAFRPYEVIFEDRGE